MGVSDLYSLQSALLKQEMKGQEYPYQTTVDLWFLLKDIQAAGPNLALLQRCYKGGFIHNRTSSSIDNHDPFLHSLEFLGGNDIACLFLFVNF
jgi:hypothetical protein